MKYLSIVISSIIVSINSAIYIYATANKILALAIFIEFIQPTILISTLNEYINAKNNHDRLNIAFFQGLGYAIGTGLTIYFI